jgi:hypothetical protein
MDKTLFVRLLLFPKHAEGGLSRVNSLLYDGARIDIGFSLTGWKAYEVSRVETFASRYICSKLLQGKSL